MIFSIANNQQSNSIVTVDLRTMDILDSIYVSNRRYSPSSLSRKFWMPPDAGRSTELVGLPSLYYPTAPETYAVF